MPKGTSLSNSLVNLLYNAVAIANIADNAATAPKTATGLELHSASPGAGGSQTTNEASYTGYARVSMARGGNVDYTAAASGATQNVNLEQFGQSSTAQALTHVSTGRDDSGAGVLWHYGALNATLNVDNLIVPQFAPGALTITES